jgi:hypothetical protein
MVFVSSSLAPWGMAFKVMLYLVEDEYSFPEYQSPLLATKDDMFDIFKIFMQKEELVNFLFDFCMQITRNKCCKGLKDSTSYEKKIA